MGNRVYLHIGIEKTGSTALQRFFSINRARLADSGVFYPVSPGDSNHLGLAAYAQARSKMDDVRRHVLVKRGVDLDTYRREFAEELTQELSAFGEGVVVFSSEHCHSRLRKREELELLRKLLSVYTDDIRIIVYLRRQDRVAGSLLATRIRFGGTDVNAVFPELGPTLPYYYDYKTILQNYSAIFGKECVQVRIYEDARSQEGGVIGDMCELLGIDIAAYTLPGRENSAMSELGLRFIAEFNKHVPRYVDGRDNPVRGSIVPVVERLCAGKYVPHNEAAARAFYARFADVNEWVRKEYFPSRTSLFDDSFDEYAEEREQGKLTFDRAVELFARIWRCTHGEHK